MDGDNLDTLTREIDTTQINGQINFTYLVIGILLELWWRRQEAAMGANFSVVTTDETGSDEVEKLN